MKAFPVLKRIIYLSLVIFLLVGCQSGEETPTPTQSMGQINRRYDFVTIIAAPGAVYQGYYAVRPESLVRILAENFPPGVILSAKLSLPGSDTYDSVAASQLDEEGKGQLVFFFPRKWDTGEEIPEGEIILNLMWNRGAERMEVPLRYEKIELTPQAP